MNAISFIHISVSYYEGLDCRFNYSVMVVDLNIIIKKITQLLLAFSVKR